MQSRRRLLNRFTRWLSLAMLPSSVLYSRVSAAQNIFVDPRPEFASSEISLILEFYFGNSEAADDATIVIEAPLVSGSKELIPFRITAPGAEKLVVVSTTNPQSLILSMDQIRENTAVVSGRARLQQTGEIVCYALRNGQIGRASRRVTLSGHWKNN